MDDPAAKVENPVVTSEPPPPEPRPRPYGAYVAVAAVALAAGAVVMWLILRSRMETAAPGPAMAAPATAPAAPAKPPEVKPVRITPERQQLIGVRSDVVEPRDLERTIRTVGVFAYDETRMAEIHTKVSGWVEKVYVDYVGKKVKRGDPLLTVYSPDLVATQNEYLLGVRQRRPGAQAGSAATVDDILVDSAKRRLRLWDIPEGEIARLERSGEPARTLTLYSPFDGVVIERNTYRGQYIGPETSAVKIADLSRIWVIAELFENELAGVHVGLEAQVLFPSGVRTEPLAGKVDFIYPSVDPRTRRVKVRIAFPNPGMELKPEAYVTVVLKTSLGRMLAAPKEAVIDTGERQYVLLALPDGYFQPRDVRIGGDATDDYYVVTDGLKAGDRVVTSAQFLVDSETNLAAAMKAMSLSMPGMEMGGGDETKGIPGMNMGPDAGPAAPKMDPNMPMPGMEHDR